jgi:cysteine desulfurase
MKERIYLDWNATAPLAPEAQAAVIAALQLAGNPSSVHREGRIARQLIEEARESVAALVGAEARCVTFTSGGSEANVLALTPSVTESGGPPRDRLLLSAIEHPSVLAGGRFAAGSVEIVPVTQDGYVDLSVLEARLSKASGAGAQAPLVSIMLANNETGVIQPVAQAAELVHRHNGLLHVDVVQASGRIPIDINALGADLLTVSGHKIGAPKGVGALVRRHRGIEIGAPLMRGGGQEQGLRAGTENVPGIAGFGAAARAKVANLAHHQTVVTRLRDRFEAILKLSSPSVVVFGERSARVPNTSLFAVPGIKAETAIIALDLEGVAVSSGAACSSGKVAPSHVLAAMGVPPDLARGAIRVSFGPVSSDSDVEGFQTAWKKVLGPLLKDQQIIAA